MGDRVVAMKSFDWRRFREAGLDRPTYKEVFVNPYPMLRLRSKNEELEETRRAYEHARRENGRLQAELEYYDRSRRLWDVEPAPRLPDKSDTDSPAESGSVTETGASLTERLEILEAELTALRGTLERQEQELETYRSALESQRAEIESQRAEIERLRLKAEGDAKKLVRSSSSVISGRGLTNMQGPSAVSGSAPQSFSDRMRALEIELSELESLYAVEQHLDAEESANDTVVPVSCPGYDEEKAKDIVHLADSVAGWIFPAPTDAQIRLVRDALKGCAAEKAGQEDPQRT